MVLLLLGSEKGADGRTCKSLCRALRTSVEMRAGLKSSSRSESCAKGIVDYRISGCEARVEVETGWRCGGPKVVAAVGGDIKHGRN
jgi:hypothetical protein